jgi:pimeloyl-ACP methyl ester carboxylesterase
MLVEANGARLAVEIAGQENREPVVLVHAGICDRRMWRTQVEALAPRFRVISYDLRGYGESPPAAGAVAHAEELRALLDALAVPRADVVGASLGGAVAIDLALAAPERVGRLALLAPAISGFEASEPHRQRMADVDTVYRKHGLGAAVEAELKLWVDGVWRGPDIVPAEVRELVRAMNTIVLANEVAHPDAHAVWLDPPAITRLEEIRAPALVIEGDLDLPDPLRRAELCATRIPGARRLVVENTAHLPSLEQPEIVNRALLDFLS